MNILIASIVVLGIIGLVSAVVLFFVAKKFNVEEDPRIDQVEAVLPGANCGGCGYPGCRGFADACVKSDSLDGKLCPVGGQAVMTKVAGILGLTAGEATPKVAVVRCSGTCTARPRTSHFDGTKSCAIITQLYAGETGCSYGCVGYGDCEAACNFDAIHVNQATGLPEVDEEKCTACGACVKACPKRVIELRNKGSKNRRVYVSCINRDKGATARKACSAACIGCGKCAKACPFGAITVENNVAYIDFEKCRLCRKCVTVCPTGAIHDVNFPAPAPAPEKKVAAPQNPEHPETAKADAVKKKTETITIEPIVKETTKTIVVEAEAAKHESAITKGQTITEPKTGSGERSEIETDKSSDGERHAEIQPAEKEKPVKTAGPATGTQAIPIINDDLDVNSLIPDELRVKPREKAKEVKQETPNQSVEMPTLDF